MISRIFIFFRRIIFGLRYQITTYFGRLQAVVLGIKIGKGVRFYGMPFIQKAKLATVLIGKQSSFRSNATSNLIGINRPCIISAHSKARLVIGEKCGFSGTVIGCFKEIIIEDNVRCGANTTITDSDWHLADPRSGAPSSIHIHSNVWLGEGSYVLKGVTIGENSLIGAGSIVTKDIPANVIAAGNPCRVIKSI